MEAGLRRLLADEVGHDRLPEKNRRRSLAGTTLTFTPDIVVDDGAAIADVKYTLSRGEWRREDLYQVTTFATVFGSRRAAVIDFTPPGTAPLSPIRIGDIDICQLSWPADAGIAGESAASAFVQRATTWLDDDCTGSGTSAAADVSNAVKATSPV